MKDIFNRGLELFSGLIYESINRYPTFIHIKSVFNDEWYNFLVPQVKPDQLDWGSINSIIKSEKEKGVSMSYYVPNKYLIDYQTHFSTNNFNTYSGSDYYICKIIDKKYNPDGELVQVDDILIDKAIDMAKICFPEWANNEQYSRYMYDNQLNNNNLIVKNYLFRVNGNDVGFCSYLGSKEMNLSYFHATGVLPEYRRKGYFTSMIEHLLNLSSSFDITDTYALVENGSGSFHGLTKLGYSVEEKYHLFST